MKKEKVFIVLQHKHNLKPNTKTPVWEVTELVEFVTALRPRHYSMSSAIGDYINQKMELVGKSGMSDYSKFEEYVRSKYAAEMARLDSLRGEYRTPVVANETTSITDDFGNVREVTVFDSPGHTSTYPFAGELINT